MLYAFVCTCFCLVGFVCALFAVLLLMQGGAVDCFLVPLLSSFPSFLLCVYSWRSRTDDVGLAVSCDVDGDGCWNGSLDLSWLVFLPFSLFLDVVVCLFSFPVSYKSILQKEKCRCSVEQVQYTIHTVCTVQCSIECTVYTV